MYISLLVLHCAYFLLKKLNSFEILYRLKTSQSFLLFVITKVLYIRVRRTFLIEVIDLIQFTVSSQLEMCYALFILFTLSPRHS